MPPSQKTTWRHGGRHMLILIFKNQSKLLNVSLYWDSAEQMRPEHIKVAPIFFAGHD